MTWHLLQDIAFTVVAVAAAWCAAGWVRERRAHSRTRNWVREMVGGVPFSGSLRDLEFVIRRTLLAVEVEFQSKRDPQLQPGHIAVEVRHG